MKFAIACLLCAVSVCMAQDQTVTITTNGTPVLLLTVPSPAKVTTKKDMTEIKTKEMELCIWTTASAKNVDQEVAQLAETIKGEVLKFVASSTNVIEIAGEPAKHLIGRGEEADDGDPATADIVVFSVGKSVFTVCVHGESNEASVERKPMLAALKTAKAP